MSKNYGTMVGCQDAIKFVQDIETDKAELKERVLARIRYEFDKDEPVKPRVYKMRYGRDSHICGNCGAGGLQVYDKYCSNCGFAIKW